MHALACVNYGEHGSNKTHPDAIFITSYVTTIDPRDVINSNGAKLTSVGQVLRQDRANVHKFGPENEFERIDAFFSEPSKRSILETSTLTSYCFEDLELLNANITKGTVPGILQVLLYQRRDSSEYVVLLNIVG